MRSNSLRVYLSSYFYLVNNCDDCMYYRIDKRPDAAVMLSPRLHFDNNYRWLQIAMDIEKKRLDSGV